MLTTPTNPIVVREISPPDLPWIRELHRTFWHWEAVLIQGRLEYPSEFRGFLAERNGDLIGTLAYEESDGVCRIVAMGSIVTNIGVGSALLGALVDKGRRSGWLRIWLITTNDNLDALRFYQ